MDYQTIRFEKRDGIGYLTLHRPDKLNAISRDMLAELRHVLSAIDTDEEVAWLSSLAPAGPFSAGFDIGQASDGKRIYQLDADEWREHIKEDIRPS